MALPKVKASREQVKQLDIYENIPFHGESRRIALILTRRPLKRKGSREIKDGADDRQVKLYLPLQRIKEEQLSLKKSAVLTGS